MSSLTKVGPVVALVALWAWQVDRRRRTPLGRPARADGLFGLERSWHTVWNGRGWLNARKLTSDEASDWHITQLEAMGERQPLANIQLHRWNGSAWQRVA